jgi:DNA-binding NarL/FixJ family response regulator
VSGLVRVFIVEDQALMRQGLRAVLELSGRVEVVGEAEDGLRALELIPAARPEVALVDVRMPRMDGVELVRRLAHAHPDVAAVILTTFDEDEYVLEGLRAGARGYLLKDTPAHELASGLERAQRGETVLPGPIAGKVVSELRRLSAPAGRPPGGEEPLSERELEVLKLVASGASNREIAQRLFITEGTVKNHVSSILGKLNLRDRTQAALYAAQRGWVEPR